MNYTPVIMDGETVSYDIRNDGGMRIGTSFPNDVPFEGCGPVTIWQARKNAMLWAAAPDLLAALKRILSDNKGPDYDGGFSMASLIKAEAAINKAKGL